MPNKEIRNCCKGCAEREIGCHSTCERYKQYREYIDEVRKRKQEHDMIASARKNAFNYAWTYSKSNGWIRRGGKKK